MKLIYRKLSILLFTFCIGILPNVFIAAEKSNEPIVITNLQWGEVLFYYFKGDKMESLIRLYAREHRQSLGKHQPQADLLAAGLLLDLDLATQAQARLDNIEQQHLDIKLKSRLSLALARVYYKKQEFKLTQHWLGLADEQFLSKKELAAKKMMQAQLLFSTGKYSQAAAQLEAISNKGNLQYYAYYNQGLSLLNLADANAQRKGRDLLSKVSNLVPTDQEQYALIDQSKLALGINALNSDHLMDARRYFLSIRLDGLVSNDALLLLGWSYAKTNQFEEALTYWKKLAAKNELLEPAIQETWLAIPYGHQQFGDLTLAVEGYEKAVTLQQQAKIQLQSLLIDEAWRSLLSESNSSAVTNKLLPNGLSRQLIANPIFYSLLKQWQQLEQLHIKLNASLDVLPTIAIVLQEKARKYAVKSIFINEKLNSDISTKQLQEFNSLKQQFEEQKSKKIAEAALSDEDYSYWKKLQKSASTIAEIPDQIGDDKIESFRRLEGVAQWKFHRQRGHDLYKVEDSLNQLKTSIKEMSNQLDTLKALANKPRKFVADDVARVDSLLQRGTILNEQLVSLQKQFEVAMSNEFLLFVEQRQMALKDLAEQANLALARLKFKAIQDAINNE